MRRGPYWENLLVKTLLAKIKRQLPGPNLARKARLLADDTPLANFIQGRRQARVPVLVATALI